ncbi:MAG: DUF2500 domain-containing protein [Clostridiales bacterium]|nr:DUF2500 domain-containing protein [Clostridiales bacterium]
MQRIKERIKMTTYEGFSTGMNHGTDFFMLFFYGIGALIAGVLLFVLLRSLYIWNKNNHSPRVTEEAEVYTKRQDFSTFMNRGRNVHFGSYHSIYVRYFVVFKTQNSGMVKLRVSSDDFDMLREGEKGQLTFQGTRFLGFEK